MEQSQNEANLSSEEIARYARHISLPEIGIKGQEKLKTSSVACIGTGGLGSPLLIYLAAAGIGRIGIVDFDVVEYSNLQRQIIHTTHSIGLLKTDSAKQHIRKINPSCRVDLFNQKLTSSNALEILKAYDVICDCSDNFPTRYLINDACLILNKPNIYGSIARFEGQVSVFNLKEDSPNYRDLIPIPPPQELIPSCSEAGVMGILPGIIGTIQAAEAILDHKFDLPETSWDHQELSTPRSFERWTGRPSGIVGGLGQHPDQFGPFGLSSRTPLRGLWLCGDSIYPGEGTAGVSQSALMVG